MHEVSQTIRTIARIEPVGNAALVRVQRPRHVRRPQHRVHQQRRLVPAKTAVAVGRGCGLDGRVVRGVADRHIGRGGGGGGSVGRGRDRGLVVLVEEDCRWRTREEGPRRVMGVSGDIVG